MKIQLSIITLLFSFLLVNAEDWHYPVAVSKNTKIETLAKKYSTSADSIIFYNPHITVSQGKFIRNNWILLPGENSGYTMKNIGGPSGGYEVIFVKKGQNWRRTAAHLGTIVEFIKENNPNLVVSDKAERDCFIQLPAEYIYQGVKRLDYKGKKVKEHSKWIDEKLKNYISLLSGEEIYKDNFTENEYLSKLKNARIPYFKPYFNKKNKHSDSPLLSQNLNGKFYELEIKHMLGVPIFNAFEIASCIGLPIDTVYKLALKGEYDYLLNGSNKNTKKYAEDPQTLTIEEFEEYIKPIKEFFAYPYKEFIPELDCIHFPTNSDMEIPPLLSHKELVEIKGFVYLDDKKILELFVTKGQNLKQTLEFIGIPMDLPVNKLIKIVEDNPNISLGINVLEDCILTIDINPFTGSFKQGVLSEYVKKMRNEEFHNKISLKERLALGRKFYDYKACSLSHENFVYLNNLKPDATANKISQMTGFSLDELKSYTEYAYYIDAIDKRDQNKSYNYGYEDAAMDFLNNPNKTKEEIMKNHRNGIELYIPIKYPAFTLREVSKEDFDRRREKRIAEERARLEEESRQQELRAQEIRRANEERARREEQDSYSSNGDTRGPAWLNGTWVIQGMIPFLGKPLFVNAALIINRSSQTLTAVDGNTVIANGHYEVYNGAIHCGTTYFNIDYRNKTIDYGNGNWMWKK